MTDEMKPLPCRILLVDDEENILRALSRLLIDEEEIEIETATSGEAGLELLRRLDQVALILSDQRMPGMSGAEFLGEAKKVAPDAVRMVLTGYADVAATMDAINKGGVTRYITKPWDDTLLLRSVREGVAQYRLLLENRRLAALVENQKEELKEWNDKLKSRVLDQTATIRQQNEKLGQRNREISRAFDNIIVAFSRLIELHSSRLKEHSAKVTELSLLVARDLGLSPEQTETLRVAALLHDIGVIGIPAPLVEKRATDLNHEERQLFLQHSVRGQSAIDEVEELREAGVLIRHHHERYDGGGYPDNLAGSAIPLGARIIACADFLDRELREGESSIAAALNRGEKEAGRQLDPEVFRLIKPHVEKLYVDPQTRESELPEKELRPKQLIEGMCLSRNLYTGSGRILLEQGTELDAGSIAMVVRQYQVDPPSCGIFVEWKVAPKITETKGTPLIREKEIRRELLSEGMRISRNLFSGTGLLLLTAGTTLDANKITALERYYRIDPPKGGVWVFGDNAE